MALVTRHDEACSNVALLSERHMKALLSGYRFVYRVYGRGMGHCDPAAPDVRYELVGHYRPREDRGAYVEAVMSALRRDGWQRVKTIDAAYSSATFRVVDLTLTLSVTGAGGTSRLPAPPTKPELVDLIVVPTGPVPQVEASPEPEASGGVTRTSLAQMTIFYPKPLPDGMTLDDSLSRAVEDVGDTGFTIDDGKGRRSLVDERPLPADVTTPCDLFGMWYRRPLHRPLPACVRSAVSMNGMPLYVENDARATTDPLYAFADADTTIVILRGSGRLLPLSRAEILQLIDRMQPVNAERMRL